MTSRRSRTRRRKADGGRRAAAWPTRTQELILRAGLLGDERGLAAWSELRPLLGSRSVSESLRALMPTLYANLVALGVEDPLLETFKEIRRQTWTANRSLFSATLPLIAAVEGDAIPTMLLKGAALVAAGTLQSGTRPMTDVDLLVPAARADAVIDRLGELGVRPIGGTPDWYVRTYVPRFSPSFSFARPDGSQLDLHWHALHACCQPDGDEDFWNAAVPVALEHLNTRVLCPADALLHAVVHGVHWAPEPGYRWVLDASMILTREGASVDLDRLVAQARRRRVSAALGAGLRYLQQVIDAPIPRETLAALTARPRSRIERLEFRAQTAPPNDWSGIERLVVLNELYVRHQGSLDDDLGWRRRVRLTRACFGIRRPGDLRDLALGGRPGPNRPLTTGHAALGSGDEQATAPPLAIGAPLDLTGFDWARTGVRYGTWLPEPAPEGCWIAGREARIVLALAAPPEGSLVLRLWGGHRLVSVIERARLEVWAGGRSLATLTVTRGASDLDGASVQIPADAISAGHELDLTLRAPDAVSPAQLGVGDDDRPLGFSLRTLAVAAPLRYRLGERLGFAAGERGESALAGGWSRAEARGSWSDGPTAKLLLVVEDPAPRMDLLLEADPYLGAPARDLRVAVLVRSERIGTLVYIAGDAGASPMRHVMISERHLDHRGELGLTFAIEHPRSPHALGLSEDRRRLGLYLRRLVLAAARSGS